VPVTRNLSKITCCQDGLTPLHCTARSGHEAAVDLLLERGAQVLAKTKNGLGPLHMAVQGDHVSCCRLLLYHKAPIDDVTVVRLHTYQPRSTIKLNLNIHLKTLQFLRRLDVHRKLFWTRRRVPKRYQRCSSSSCYYYYYYYCY